MRCARLALELRWGKAIFVNGGTGFVNGKDVQFTKRQWQLPLAVRHAGAALAVGLLLGFLGPFGTGTTLSLAVRYAFWLGLSLFGYACVLAAGRIVKSGGPELALELEREGYAEIAA